MAATALATATSDSKLHQVLMFKEPSWLGQMTARFSAKADGTVEEAPKSALAGEYFLFFTTYPGCGATCEPIFIKLREITEMMAKTGSKHLTIVNCPYPDGWEQQFQQYYWSKKVTWPWVKFGWRPKALQHFSEFGIVAFTGCPMLTLVHATPSKVQQIKKTAGSNQADHVPIYKACEAIVLTGQAPQIS